jgi:CMP-N-acetylneuraminic acid synthetase
VTYQIVIPARGGSKRFPKKNINSLNGIPLIGHSILFALKSVPPDNIWVNTDDTEIAQIASEYGINITFRPSELGTDETTTSEVLFFQAGIFELKKIDYDAMILLQPTNPLRPDGLIENAIKLFENKKRQSLATFSILNRKYGKIKSEFYFPENYKPGQRIQDIKPNYFENGLIYITSKEAINNKVIITPDVYPLILSEIESLVDIDEPSDILFAEFLLRNKQVIR